MTNPADYPKRRREDVMGEPTLRELERRLDDLQGQVYSGFRDMAEQVKSLKYVSIDRYQAEQDALRDRVARIEASNVWLSRTIVAILISAIVTALTAVVMARGGL